ncbi:glutamyl-tRNA reductase [Flavilitoribacter nigricans]|uniref:Glutamyl-tRNA reductase n=1 Tax=Flavilitoribacter nigricans (strain ATCC 23147 / DSM 23189 / NBRC 102662 / NCIMB 1420 / SS-2) TaxID=1122177 RepID=A0A2D0N6I9_FLAN2|nr:glutamyl-tRNA reductase [Flavilitoribacter nigricans]PHN03996.1 glutamyl-tRNA reductase [Flavilitoribacter nigricans DSM 23189 = NBRC 102662]
MLERLKILTVTHKRTNLNEIGDYVLKTGSKDELCQRLQKLKFQLRLDELMYLSTCNRVMYCLVTDHAVDASYAGHFFQKINPELSLEQLETIEEKVQILEGEEAMAHLFDVAASIDSLVIGERQILRQLREAYEQCHAWELTGDFIRLLIQQSIQSAKEVYAKTRIGEKPVSVVSLAIQQLMRTHLPKNARILLVGAGQTNNLVAKFLLKHGFNQVTVFNRTLEKAQEVAELLEGKAYLLADLADYRVGFDAMVVCTGATEAIITPELYEQLLNGETSNKIVIDLAIPNNVDREVVEQFSVHYIEIEGLRNLAKENLAFREQEIVRAHHLINRHLTEFPALLKQRQLEVALREVPNAIKDVKRKAIEEVFRKEVEVLDDNTRELLDRMLTYMEKKCIGIPMKAAREAIIQ